MRWVPTFWGLGARRHQDIVLGAANIDTEEAKLKLQVPTSEELINRAEALLPRLRERSRQAEENRRLSDETVQEFRAAGFHKILQPKRFGGFELGIDAVVF